MNTSVSTFSLDELAWEKSEGLIPAVVCHAITGKVLMVAWCNREALEKTVSLEQVTFYSRSRKQLWTKGETSGNTLRLSSIKYDCDKDTVLITALPAGPTCHTGTESCFDTEEPTVGSGFLGQLEAIILQRQKNLTTAPNEKSYTTKLLSEGTARIAQKVGEEGVEVALAGVQQNSQEICDESADLLYHLLVLLADQKIPLERVLEVLWSRHTKSSN